MRALFLILVIMGTPAVASAQEETFEDIVALGKLEFQIGENLTNADGANDSSGTPHFKTAIDLLTRATLLNPRDQESLYYLAYARDRTWKSYSPGNGLPDFSLSHALAVSEPLEQLLAISPQYDGEIVILLPRSKLTATWGSLAAGYISRGHIDSARWALVEGRRRGGFPDLTMENCRNILRSCDSNAIVLVNGDDDTFPMWYAQLIEGFRRDVTIVNIPLTNTRWYTKQLKLNYPFGNNPLPLTYCLDELDTLKYLLIEEPLAMRLPVPASVGAAYGFPTDTIVGWSIPGRSAGESQYIAVQDLILLDVLKANNWRRPIYYSSTVESEYIDNIGLGSFLQLEGLASRITPERRESMDRLRDAEPLHRLLMSTQSGFDCESIRRDSFDTEHARFTSIYAGLFVRLALYRRDVDRSPESVATVMREMERVLPIDQLFEWLCSPATQGLTFFSCDDIFTIVLLFGYGGMDQRHDELMRFWKSDGVEN